MTRHFAVKNAGYKSNLKSTYQSISSLVFVLKSEPGASVPMTHLRSFNLRKYEFKTIFTGTDFSVENYFKIILFRHLWNYIYFPDFRRNEFLKNSIFDRKNQCRISIALYCDNIKVLNVLTLCELNQYLYRNRPNAVWTNSYSSGVYCSGS